MIKHRGESSRSFSYRALTSKTLFSLLLLLALLGLMEVLLRSTHALGARLSVSQPDSLIAWRYIPDREYWHGLENDHPITGRINSHGWRDRERTVSKPEGSYRIAVLGDSYVQALQVELDSTFLAIAERHWQHVEGRPVEVLNFGRSGMTQTEEYIVLRSDAVRFDPDLVVLFFLTGNDIYDINRATAGGKMRPYFNLGPDGDLHLDTSFNHSREFRLKELIQPLKANSALVSLITERFNALKRSRAQEGHAGGEFRGEINGPLTLCTAHPDSLFLVNYILNKRIITEMAEYCQRGQIQFMLACIDGVYKTEDIAQFQRLDPTFDPDFFERDLEGFAHALGVSFLGLQTRFREYYARTGEELHWGHWNYAGHRLVARELIKAVEAQWSQASSPSP
jgi:hypothetical protein